MIYEIIDTRTGERAKARMLVQEPWAEKTQGCGWPALAIDENGDVMLTDDCGNYDMVPEGRVEVRLVVDREKWEPCRECSSETHTCETCRYREQMGYREGCNECTTDNDKWKPRYKFCPNCGRPFSGRSEAKAWAELEKKIMGCVE